MERYNILKNLQRKNVTKAPMLETLKKVDESKKGTNQISVSEKSRECMRET